MHIIKPSQIKWHQVNRTNQIDLEMDHKKKDCVNSQELTFYAASSSTANQMAQQLSNSFMVLNSILVTALILVCQIFFTADFFICVSTWPMPSHVPWCLWYFQREFFDWPVVTPWSQILYRLKLSLHRQRLSFFQNGNFP